MKEAKTKERILDSAEALFAKKGLKHTSVRDITSAAGAHLASVNYHFRSKDGLLREVVQRRIVPLNRERLRLLKDATKRYGKKAVPVETTLHALLAPAIKLYFERPHFLSVTGQIVSDPDDEVYKIFLFHFQEVFSGFKEVSTESLPHIEDEEIMWRIHFLMGAMIHTWTSHSGLERLSGGVCRLSDEEETINRLIAFCAAGLRAPEYNHPHEDIKRVQIKGKRSKKKD
jgi:AcrR family transcriptional regulator